MDKVRFQNLGCVLFAAAMLAGLGGCDMFKKPPKLAGGGMDMFTPVKMRVHPLSRIVPGPPSGDATVEARLELMDQFNDTTKGAGSVYFELYVYEPLVPNHHGDRIKVWNFDINTPRANQEHWDGITRTYLFKLPVAMVDLKHHNRVLLSATLTLPNGARLTDGLPITLANPK